jgi:hypothetical protein
MYLRQYNAPLIGDKTLMAAPQEPPSAYIQS